MIDWFNQGNFLKPLDTLLLAALFPFVFCYPHSHGIQLALEQIVGTPEETLEAVQDVFSSVDGTFHDDFSGLAVMRNSANPEVLTYVLSKTVNLEPYPRANGIVGLICARRYKSNFNLAVKIVGFSVIQVCLDDLNQSKMIPKLKDVLKNCVKTIIRHRCINLVKLFLSSGAPFPDQLSIKPDSRQTKSCPLSIASLTINWAWLIMLMP